MGLGIGCWDSASWDSASWAGARHSASWDSASWDSASWDSASWAGTQTDRDDRGDLIICPMLCYSNGTDNKGGLW